MDYLGDLLRRRPELVACENEISDACQIICIAYESGGKLLLCGNGGSASDCEHIVGELMKSFVLKRTLTTSIRERLLAVAPEHADYLSESLQMALPAISLPSQIGINTAFANDVSADLCYAQQVLGYGVAGDVLIGLTTSGNSKNIIYSFEVAAALGLKTISLTGGTGGKIAGLSDISIIAPSDITSEIQEYHLMIYHCICKIVEQCFFGR